MGTTWHTVYDVIYGTNKGDKKIQMLNLEYFTSNLWKKGQCLLTVRLASLLTKRQDGCLFFSLHSEAIILQKCIPILINSLAFIFPVPSFIFKDAIICFFPWDGEDKDEKLIK